MKMLTISIIILKHDRMKRNILLAFLTMSLWASAQQSANIPNTGKYLTLKCDLHTHTVFSDGMVWPDVRVVEALYEKIDVIAITDHIEHQKYADDLKIDLNRAYEIASTKTDSKKVVVISGGEITRGMPPGHINTLFVEDVSKLKQEKPEQAIKEAAKQNAFVFWNHPCWVSHTENGIAKMYPIIEKNIKKNIIKGMEVVNDYNFCRQAFQWCLDYNLTILANSDAHGPVSYSYRIFEGKHRPLTLVFATEKSKKAVKEALVERRTAAWFENNIIGREEMLLPLFNACVRTKDIWYNKKVAWLTLENLSGIDLYIKNIGEYGFYNKTDLIVLNGNESIQLGVCTGDIKEAFELKLKVLNFWITPDDVLKANITCKR